MVRPTDNVSQKIMDKLAELKAMSGNSKKIDTPAEYEALGQLLANETGKGNREYIKGLMVEYQEAYPTLEQVEKQKAYDDMMRGVSESVKKQVERLTNSIEKAESSCDLCDTFRLELNKLYNSDGLSEDEKKYLEQIMDKYHIPLKLHVVNMPNLSGEEFQKMDDDADIVRDALQRYTTKNEQKIVSDIINNDINSENVMEFLKNYTHRNYSNKEGFFEQLFTEFNFPDKVQLLNKMATHLDEYLQKYDGYYYDPTAFKDALANNPHYFDGVTVSQARDLDKLVSQQIEIDYNMDFPVQRVDEE